MTHTTEQDRAGFETWLAPEYSREKWHTGEYTDDTVFSMFAAWQAARRAPAVPVPQGLFDAIEHGDETHRGWLKSALEAFFSGKPIPQEVSTAKHPPAAAPVPQFNHSAKRKLNYLLEAGETITGYAFQNKDGRRGSIDCHGFVAWWHDAAAPQPPEADMGIPISAATPVQLPENLREGEPYDNPAFEALARALGVWGTAQSAVCAQFWIAAKGQST